MFERHFGLRENPFHSGHQLRFLYPSREHQEARAHLRYGIENREPFVLITGEVGTGKTTALYDALAEWGSKVAVALITNSALTRQELIEEIALRFGVSVPPGTSKPQALALLERHLAGVRGRGEHAVLLLDEAQNLAPELLEEIRLLSNLEVQGDRLMQIFLVGQPELEALLSDAQLRQLRQRISVHYRLNPLSHEETLGYIHHRIAVAGGNPWATFPAESCREVYRITHGIPREINNVASQALIAAYSEGVTTVQPNHVKEAVRESEFRSVIPGAANVPDDPMPGLATPAVPMAAPAMRQAPAPAAEVAPPPMPVAMPAIAPAPALVMMPVQTPAPPIAPAPSEPMPAAAAVAASAPEPVAAEPAPAYEPPPAATWTPPVLTPEPVPSPPPAPMTPIAPAARTTTAEEDVAEATRALDAWTAAAQELMLARRRSATADAPQRVEVVASDAAVQGAHSDEPEPPARVPTPAELYARAATADPESADLSGLPGRLRDKIAADIAADERRESTRRRAVPALVTAIIAIAVIAGVVVLQRLQVIDVPALRGVSGTRARAASSSAPVASEPLVVTRHSKPAPVGSSDGTQAATAAVPPAPATPASVQTAAAATPMPAQAKPMVPPATAAPVVRTQPTPTSAATAPPAHVTATAAPAVAKPASTAAPKSAEASSALPAPKPAVKVHEESTVFGLGVAAYLDRDRAEQERARLASASGLPSLIVPFDDGGTTRYRVVLGRYTSNAAAERAALDVLEKLHVSEAQPLVISRPKAH